MATLPLMALLGACAQMAGSSESYEYRAGLCGGRGVAAQSSPFLGGVFVSYAEVSACYEPWGGQYYFATSDAQTYPGNPMVKPFSSPPQWEVKSPVNGQYYRIN